MNQAQTRVEHDLLGERAVPAEAYEAVLAEFERLESAAAASPLLPALEHHAEEAP